MTELIRGILDGSISPKEAQKAALAEFEISQISVRDKWMPHGKNLISAGEHVVSYALDVVEQGSYPPCRRAGFFAALYDGISHTLSTKVHGTAPAHGLPLDCQFGESCMRDETRISGDRYDNCTSVHAAQWLRVPDGRLPWKSLWLESGAILKDGKYILSRKNSAADAPYSSKIYRCSMCLKTMLGQGVEDLALVSLDEDGKVEFQFASIRMSLATLMVCNVAEMESGVS